MPAPIAFIEGLKSIAQERGTNVTEAAMLGILAEWPVNTPPDLDDIGDIIAALRELKVEDTYLYIEGLLYGAGIGVRARNVAIWESAHQRILNAQDNKAFEHLEYIRKGYTCLTGKRFSRTP